jgi:hypothetical protein
VERIGAKAFAHIAESGGWKAIHPPLLLTYGNGFKIDRYEVL